jgi:hypothetical protein
VLPRSLPGAFRGWPKQTSHKRLVPCGQEDHCSRAKSCHRHFQGWANMSPASPRQAVTAEIRGYLCRDWNNRQAQGQAGWVSLPLPPGGG